MQHVQIRNCFLTGSPYELHVFNKNGDKLKEKP